MLMRSLKFLLSPKLVIGIAKGVTQICGNTANFSGLLYHVISHQIISGVSQREINELPNHFIHKHNS